MSSYTEIDTALLDLDFTNPVYKIIYKTIRKKADQENYLLCC